MSLFLFHDGLLTGLIMCRSHGDNYSCCDLMSTLVLSCTEDIITPSSSFPLPRPCVYVIWDKFSHSRDWSVPSCEAGGDLQCLILLFQPSPCYMTAVCHPPWRRPHLRFVCMPDKHSTDGTAFPVLLRDSTTEDFFENWCCYQVLKNLSFSG